MKKIAMTASAALLALSGAAFAQGAAPTGTPTPENPLTSASIEQLRELRPDVDVNMLTPIQIEEINAEVEDDGLDESELITILGEAGPDTTAVTQ